MMNLLENLRDFYETTYPSINPRLDIGDANWKFSTIKPYLACINPDNVDRVLELGCGSGKLLEKVSSYFDAQGIGMDISHRILMKSRAMSSGISTVQGKADELPVKIDKFGVIYFADLLEHLEEPGKFLSRFKDTGSLIMLIPLESGWISNTFHHYRRLMGKPTTRETYGHLHRWNRSDVLKMIEESGLVLAGHKVKRGLITEYKSARGRAYGRISDFIHSLSPSLHEKLFGSWTFVGHCRAIK